MASSSSTKSPDIELTAIVASMDSGAVSPCGAVSTGDASSLLSGSVGGDAEPIHADDAASVWSFFRGDDKLFNVGTRNEPVSANSASSRDTKYAGNPAYTPIDNGSGASSNGMDRDLEAGIINPPSDVEGGRGVVSHDAPTSNNQSRAWIFMGRGAICKSLVFLASVIFVIAIAVFAAPIHMS